jgi:cohesin complex subunit SA-1/2
MPEYKHLICNWAAMLRALQGDERRKSISKGDQRQDTVKQRVLLRMFVTAVTLEVTDAVTDYKTIVDPDLVDARQAEYESLQTTKKKPTKNSSSHEELTLALLRALPDLLISFKSETSVLQSLTTLPQYFRKCELFAFLL